MEVQFNKTACPYLRRAVCQIQNQEQTQEVRLSDAMPDIGSVLGSWGQVLIRGKEWRSGSMGVSGGVMAWVLYAPEDGSQPRSIETWIPFQFTWDLPETQRDGAICVTPMVKAVDARSTSARKLMVRANISMLGEALEPVEADVFNPDGLDADIQLLTKSYPMELAQEAGEKLFQIDEELILPGSFPAIDQILRYELTPEVTEQKVMAGRLVFRGKALLHLLYSAADGSVHTWDREIPISQFTELDRDHSTNATGWIILVPTALELEKAEDGKLLLKGEMAAQYVIYDRLLLNIVEDAYSPLRSVAVQTAELCLPVRLDVSREKMRLQADVQAQGESAVDVCWMPEFPSKRSNGDHIELTVPGQFQVLYADREGVLHSMSAKAEETWQLPSDSENIVDGFVRTEGRPQAVFSGETGSFIADMMIEAAVFSQKGIPMVCGLELGEKTQPDQDRPSIVLRRAGDAGLWNIAKECGSTVEAICKANQLDSEPDRNKMLLIPLA